MSLIEMRDDDEGMEMERRGFVCGTVMTSWDDKIMIFGGWNGIGKTYFGSFGSLELEGEEWVGVDHDDLGLEGRRYSCMSDWKDENGDGYVVVFGGETKKKKRLDQVIVMNRDMQLMDVCTGNDGSDGPSGRFGASLTNVEGTLKLFGGKGRGHKNDLWSLSLSCEGTDMNAEWKLIETETSPSERGFHSSVAWNGKMIIAFGAPKGNSNDVWMLDEQCRWEEMKCSNAPKQGRDDHISAVLDDQMVVVGGTKDGIGPCGEILILDLVEREWKEVEWCIDGRYAMMGCVMGDRMVVWGGKDGKNCFADGWRVGLEGRERIKWKSKGKQEKEKE
eukprot:TRINITY_DN946_c2_g2_i1.p1 TRINITY_DN946_c2_g2~~TRINITY_DN946_c2_g2_i1.p1  ORF type:complete len:333 (-),score=85.18 TRINITY_DN946_c2_g2_i1:120-1118(-)